MSPGAIITDIEGTTTSAAFVYDVLFPYARARLPAFVAAHSHRVTPILDQVRAHAGNAALDVKDCVARLLEWHDSDAKIGPIKALQGLIWAEGYADGVLKGHVYPDAVQGLRRWHEWGIRLFVYSSGSVGAQRLLFAHTDFGDLTPLFSGYFDTAVGGKWQSSSYDAIADAILLARHDILFVSDVVEELDAARTAGLSVTLVARSGVPNASLHTVVTSFDAILPSPPVP